MLIPDLAATRNWLFSSEKTRLTRFAVENNREFSSRVFTSSRGVVVFVNVVSLQRCHYIE